MEEMASAQIPEIPVSKATEKPVKKVVKKKARDKKPASKKRYMKARKCYIADEEMAMLKKKSGISGSISESNILRFLLDLPMNTPGRKKKNPLPAFNLDFLDE